MSTRYLAYVIAAREMLEDGSLVILRENGGMKEELGAPLHILATERSAPVRHKAFKFSELAFQAICQRGTRLDSSSG